MLDTTLILLGAGNSTRFDSYVKKQWLYIDEIPLWLHVAEKFNTFAKFEKTIIVTSKQDISIMKNFADFEYVEGGKTRQESLTNAMKSVTTTYTLVSDIARACIPEELIVRLLDAKDKGSCVVPSIPLVDTLYLDGKPIDRDRVQSIQTPQLSKTTLLKKALDTDIVFTDDSSAIASLGEKVHFVEGSPTAHKLTTLSDLRKLDCLDAPSLKVSTGFGIDTHPFDKDKDMYLCGVKMDEAYGFKAHSDGDVAIHAVIDALLGAAGMGDIGELYPDTDTSFENIDSKILLKDTVNIVKSHGFSIEHIDLTIVAQVPKISPYKQQMKIVLASILNIRQNHINIKATTSEKLGFIGREEGVTVHAIANLTYFNWKNL